MAELKPILGRVEQISIPSSRINALPIKVDTGAYRSSIWASEIKEENGILSYKLLAPKSDLYTGIPQQTSDYRQVSVESSFGHKQKRYSVFITVVVKGKKIRSNFTLANRSGKTYPALIGRKMLKNRFLVDVSQGQPLEDEERNGDDSLE